MKTMSLVIGNAKRNRKPVETAFIEFFHKCRWVPAPNSAICWHNTKTDVGQRKFKQGFLAPKLINAPGSTAKTQT